MEDDRQSPETALTSVVPNAGRVADEAGGFLRQLVAFPGSQAVGPLPPLPLPRAAAQSEPIGGAAGAEADPVSSIVEQAASVLDDEMARGVLAASSGAAPRGQPDAANPVLRQLQEVVDTLATLWPNLRGGVAQNPSAGPPASQPAPVGAQPLATLSPRAAVKPGGRAIVSMTLRNSEDLPVMLRPMATDLLGSHGGRIAAAHLDFDAAEIALEVQEEKHLTISAIIPAETAPGRYSGLLVLSGLDDVRALVSIEVAGTEATADHPKTPPLNPGGDGRTSDADGSGMDPPQARNGTPQTARLSPMMQAATKLAEDGELGNSDAIHLLHIPHRPEDVKAVLARFDRALTREARRKLILELFAPLPDGVDNQRYEPIFDRHPITGQTYTTANGAVVLNEVRYYNGEMVQLFGECPNIAQVRQDLAGSGYKPLVLRHADGREAAVAQFWAHNLSDTSLQPYDASFVIVAAVPEDAPADQAHIAANENGVSSVLSMFDGAFDPAEGRYENRTRLFFVRLLDSTQVAIDVGRERMGTDKRPGTVRIKRTGRRRSFAVADGAGNGVATIGFVIADDGADHGAGDASAFGTDMAAAAATAGIPFRALPAGTEYVYPGVARIGTGPVVTWQWRTDLMPRLQRAEPNSVAFDARSDEGAMLIRWGFKPQVLGYIPNVRGAVTGLS